MENRFFKMSEVAKEDPKQALKTMFCNTDKDLKFIGVIAPHPAEYVALP